MKRRTYGWDRVRLYEHYTADELAAWTVELSTDPANHDTEHGLNAETRKKTAALAYAIYYHQCDKRKAGAA